MAEPRFFSKEWADAVREALIAGPSEPVKEGKLQEYWDFYELIKSGYPASWALGCPARRHVRAGYGLCGLEGAARRLRRAAHRHVPQGPAGRGQPARVLQDDLLLRGEPRHHRHRRGGLPGARRQLTGARWIGCDHTAVRGLSTSTSCRAWSGSARRWSGRAPRPAIDTR